MFDRARSRDKPVAWMLPWCLASAILLAAACGAGPAGPRGGVAKTPSRTVIAVAIVDLAVVTLLVARGVDVRLVLLLGALLLFVATGRPGAMAAKLVAEMANPGTVVPICSAMGFAYVLRATGCDRHLVHLLVQPLRRARVVLIPGGIVSGYLINTTIVSQAGTAAVLGPILIPLLRAAGLGSTTAGAILLLGSSAGGELFNPGAVEMRKLAELTGLTGAAVVGRSAPLNLLGFSAALGAFWLLALRRERSRPEVCPNFPAPDQGASDSAPFRVNLFKALVPILPLLILFTDHALGSSSVLRGLEGPARILTAMLIGVAAAAVSSWKTAGGLATAFFEGAGYAYNHVISLIVVASTFAEAVRLSGLIELLIQAILPWPMLARVVATIAPWSLAVVSGTGIAPAVAIMEFFIPAAGSMGLEPVQLGTLAALGAHYGRTMSPAAAVVMVSSRLAQSSARELIREVAIPLFVGGAVLLVAAMLRVF
ncbi:MAG: C4-dicarboxylate transporter DcuC [Isosphaeraceae bacterium]